MFYGSIFIRFFGYLVEILFAIICHFKDLAYIFDLSQNIINLKQEHSCQFLIKINSLFSNFIAQKLEPKFLQMYHDKAKTKFKDIEDF